MATEIERVVAYKTSGGKVCESLKEAQEWERRTRREAKVNRLICSLMPDSLSGDLEEIEDMLEEIEDMLVDNHEAFIHALT